MKFFEDENNMQKYFEERNSKYETRKDFFSITKVEYYFNDWLRGFIEAEGSFSIRKNGTSSFSIGQNFDLILIEGIRDFFKINHLKINTSINKISKTKFYRIDIQNLIGVNRVIDHCKDRIQGYKYLQICDFISKSKALKPRIKEFVSS